MDRGWRELDLFICGVGEGRGEGRGRGEGEGRGERENGILFDFGVCCCCFLSFSFVAFRAVAFVLLFLVYLFLSLSFPPPRSPHLLSLYFSFPSHHSLTLSLLFFYKEKNWYEIRRIFTVALGIFFYDKFNDLGKLRAHDLITVMAMKLYIHFRVSVFFAIILFLFFTYLVIPNYFALMTTSSPCPLQQHRLYGTFRFKSRPATTSIPG